MKISLTISPDAIVVIDDGRGTDFMEKFYYVERPAKDAP